MKPLTAILISITLTHICFLPIEITEVYMRDTYEHEVTAQAFLSSPKTEANTDFMSVFNKIASQVWSWMAGDRSKDDENTCPVCHKKDQVISIRYGKPNRELMQQAEEGKVRLGGCDKSGRPSRYCKRDDKEF